MHKKWIIAGGLAVLGGVGLHAAPVIAHTSQAMLDGGRRVARIHAMIADLGLSNEQKERIKEIVGKSAPTVEPIVDEIKRNHIALRKVTENGNDEARVREIASRQGQLVSELTVEGARVKTEIFAVLTPDQRRKIEGDETQVEQLITGRHFADFLNAALN